MSRSIFQHVLLASLAALGCACSDVAGDDAQTPQRIPVQIGAADPAGIPLSMRADAVSPSAAVDVTLTIEDTEQTFADVVPGTTFDLGTVASATRVRLDVVNVHGAGVVRAHILTSNCFRRTAMCGADGCVASAEYVVIEETCVNF